jgi:hypothetical protein
MIQVYGCDIRRGMRLAIFLKDGNRIVGTAKRKVTNFGADWDMQITTQTGETRFLENCEIAKMIKLN